MELKTLEEFLHFKGCVKENGMYSYVSPEDIKEYTLQIAEAACKEQRELCAEDLPQGTSQLVIDCILDTPQPDIDKLLK